LTPRYRVVAGPNGSGKTTLMRRLAADYAVNFYSVLNADDIFTVWVSPCTALKASHRCDLAMTEIELGEAIRRVCVSRYTMHQVWKDAEIAEFDASVSSEGFSGNELGCLIQNAKTVCASGVPAIRAADEYDFADFFACPGGCPSGGGRYRK